MWWIQICQMYLGPLGRLGLSKPYNLSTFYSAFGACMPIIELHLLFYPLPYHIVYLLNKILLRFNLNLDFRLLIGIATTQQGLSTATRFTRTTRGTRRTSIILSLRLTAIHVSKGNSWDSIGLMMQIKLICIIWRALAIRQVPILILDPTVLYPQ